MKLKVDIKKGILSNVIENLKNLQKNHAEVGVYGGKEKTGGDLVEIAKVHEFGSPTNNIPKRSFLEEPIKMHKKPLIKLFKDDLNTLKGQKNGWERILLRLALQAQGYCLLAFKTQGFGKWAPLNPITYFRKLKKGKGSGGVGILVDTGELRRNVRGVVAKNTD